MEKRLWTIILCAIMLILLLTATAFATATDSGSQPTVTGVTVTPNTVSVVKGGTCEFSATVTGENNPDRTVRWELVGSISDTFIDENGKLSVILFEDAKTLIVKAVSVFDESRYGTATVTVTTPVMTFSPSAGAYSAEQSVTILYDIKDATIHYTTDNSDPTESSPIYDGAISVKEPTVIKAIAVIPDVYTSEIFTAEYTQTDDSSGSGTDSGGHDNTPDPVTIYNNTDIPDANVWLTGNGLDSSDLLITERNPAGSAYKALLDLADSADVLDIYNIYLRSGGHNADSAMQIGFNVTAINKGQEFTLVHQKGNGEYEYFYDAADANGNLNFGPLYELSPFMLVKGHMTPNPDTGDVSIPELWLHIMFMVGAGLIIGLVIRRKIRQNG